MDLFAPNPTAGQIRVMVVDDDPLVRQGAVGVLSSVPGVKVVAEAADPIEALSCLGDTCPQVVVLDIRMPPTYRMEGIEAAQRIRREHVGVGVVILSQHADPEYALELLREGSAGRAYLLKERLGEPARLVEAIRAVAAGGSVLDPKVVEGLVEAQRGRAHSRLRTLTPGEAQVLGPLVSGGTDASIAQDLEVSEACVAAQVASILRKLHLSEFLDVDHRVAALLFFLQRALD